MVQSITKKTFKYSLLLLLVFFVPISSAASITELNFGVFAYRPKPVMQQRFQPLADYLNEQLQDIQIKLHILDLNEIELAVNENRLDLIFTNPRHSVLLRDHNNLTGIISTVIKRCCGAKETSSLGGVIIARKTRQDITSLDDIVGKTIAVPGTKYLGGYLSQRYELLQAGIELPESQKLLKVGEHNHVVSAVLSSIADIGFIRTEVLEDLHFNGHLDLNKIKIINPQQFPGFPFISSTRLYPEWPVIALPHLEKRLINRIASALLNLQADHPASRAAKIGGFTPPADYLPVEKITRALLLPPYDHPSIFTWHDEWKKHKTGAYIVTTSFIIIGLLVWLLGNRNRRLTAQQHVVKHYSQRLKQIIEATQTGTWEWNIAADDIIINRHWAEMLGYSEVEILPFNVKRSLAMLHPDDVKLKKNRLKQHFFSKTDYYEADFRLKHKDGHWIWINDRGQVTQWATDGSPLTMSGTQMDITDRKETELQLKKLSQRFAKISSRVPGVVYQFRLKPDGKYCFPYANEKIQEIYQVTPEEVKNDATEIFSRLHPDDHDMVVRSLQDSADRLISWQLEYRIRHKNGDIRWLFGNASTEREADGSTLWNGFITDISEHKKAEENLRLASSVFNHSQESIIITDPQTRIIDANPACLQLTGYSKEELIGQKPSILNSSSQSPEFYAKMWRQLNAVGHWKGEIENRKKSGELYTEQLSIDTVKDQSGKLQHYVGVFSDISYLKEQKQALERVAYSDSLTELPNRLLLRDRMQQALAQAERHEKLVSICYLDLDGFKDINDSYGHEIGDKVLIEVASRLKQVLRSEDTVARLGGDEFVLLLLNLHNVEELEHLISRVLETVAVPHTISKGNTARVSASIGIALYPLDESEADTLLRHADHAMYVAKKLGKNRYSFFNPGEDKRATAAHFIQHEVQVAIKKQELRLHYQPKVNMRTGKVTGVEALVRWQHPDKGLLSPGEFLPAIEHSPLIIELGNWVLRQVLTQMQEWQSNGLILGVSVNIAAMQLQQSSFVTSLETLLNKFPAELHSRLELEILETAALHDMNHVSRIMKECVKLGVQFALDDFGTGYSSLTYLKRLPARTLKIDRSFVHDLLDNPDDVAITEGILSLTRAFGRIPIAEGVETIQHGTLLLSLGCEMGQGYGIARPMPPEDLPSWIANFQVVPEWKNSHWTVHSNSDVSLLLMAAEHHRLVARVLTAVEQGIPSLLPETLQDRHACQFGHWLNNEGAQQYGQQPEFSNLLIAHKQVHRLCKDVTEQLKDNDNQALSLSVKQLKTTSNHILDKLNKLRR